MTKKGKRGTIAGLEVPLDGLIDKFDVDDFYFYDSKNEGKASYNEDNKNNDSSLMHFESTENTANDEKEYKNETVESIEISDPESESTDEIFAEPENKSADFAEFDFSIPSFDEAIITNDAYSESEIKPEIETNDVDFGLKKSYIELQKPIDDVEIMNSWWSKLQSALDDAGCEIDMKCPEDLCRIIVCEISKMDKNSCSHSILKGIRSGSIFYLYKGKSKVFYVPYLTRSFNAGSQYYVPAKMVVDLQQLDDLLQEIKNGNII